jgi:hypothetical protein
MAISHFDSPSERVSTKSSVWPEDILFGIDTLIKKYHRYGCTIIFYLLMALLKNTSPSLRMNKQLPNPSASPQNINLAKVF